MNFTLFPLPEVNRKFWYEQKKYNFALDTYYVSNLKDEDILGMSNYLKNDLGDNSFIQKVVIKSEQQVHQTYLSQNYNDAFGVMGDQKHRTMVGSYLRIISAYEDEEHKSYIDAHIIKAVNYIRFKYGLGAASELADYVIFDLENGNPAKQSNSIVPFVFGDGRQQNSFYENSYQSGFLKSQVSVYLNEVASTLFDIAISSDNPSHRFLFLCIALESQIGDGGKRKVFCENELKSELISKEMYRIFQLRHQLAHGESFIEDGEFRNSIPNLFELLRLSAIREDTVRSKLVNFLEKKLNDNSKRD